MKVIKKGKEDFQFTVKMPFMLSGRSVEIGEKVHVDEPEATGLVKARKLAPIFPETLECFTLKSFILPGLKEKFTARRGERVLIKRDDLLPLLFAGICIPSDESIWRPLGRKLKQR